MVKQLRLTLGLTLVLLNDGTLFADHAPIDSRSRAPSGRLCVCEFQQEPSHCFKMQSPEDCTNVKDCIWTISRAGGGNCRNWHQHYCDKEFQQRPPTGGCDSVRIVPYGGAVPICDSQFGEYYYTYHGHGGRAERFLNTVRYVIPNSHRSCNFSFKDQACLSFSKHHEDGGKHIAEIRDLILNGPEALRSLLRGAQQVRLTANQIEAFDTIEPPYKVTNPDYSFVFNQKEILGESATSCNISPPCNASMVNRSFLCSTSNGIRRRVCCPGRFTGFDWEENVVRCTR